MKYGQYGLALAKVVFRPVIAWAKNAFGRPTNPLIRRLCLIIGRRACALRAHLKRLFPNAFPRDSKEATMDEHKIAEYGVKTLFLFVLYGIAIGLPSLELRKSRAAAARALEEAKQVKNNIATLNNTIHEMRQELENMQQNNLQYEREVVASQREAGKNVRQSTILLAQIEAGIQNLASPSTKPTI